MTQKSYYQDMQQAVEKELKHQLARVKARSLNPFQEILTYHMGWTGDGADLETRGKRIRSLLLLLITAASGHDWQPSLPAASAVELIHNFSLIHDDIQDGSITRRGRLSVWKKWGVPMAINAGDALFSLANLSILDLQRSYSDDIVLRAANYLHSACLDLTNGQFLDMEYQQKISIPMENYWVMIKGKTASLISAACAMGALLGDNDVETIDYYYNFGLNLGLAFQIHDDYLGIWGEEEITGKSAASDILNKKKTFPIIFGINKGELFPQYWINHHKNPHEIQKLVSLLEEEGSLSYTKKRIQQLSSLALSYLGKANPHEPYRSDLEQLTKALEQRNK